MPRKYEHVQELLPIVKELREKGKTYNEIAQKLGMANGEVARELLRRERMNIPVRRCRQTADDGAPPPPKWCMETAQMVRGLRA